MGVASPTHLLVVMAIIVLLFGAKRIPELARALGGGMREFRHGISGAYGEETSTTERES